MGNPEVLVFTGGPPPNWLEKHAWFAPVTVVPADKMPMVGLKKIELKVEMCCMKCAEIVSEEIREVPGVMDVQIDYVIKKVTVIGKPYGPDVLRRARRVDKKADYWPPPPPPPPTPPTPPPPPPAPDPPSCTACQCAVCKPPPPKEEPKKEEEKKEEKKEEEKKEEKKEEEKKEEKKEEEKKEEEKKEEPKKEEEKKEEEKKEEPKKEEEKKEEEKKEEPKKEEKKEEPKKEETPGVQAVQYPPYEYLVGRFPGYDYHPSQSYNPLLPHHPFPYSRQVYFDWPHFRTTEAGAEAAFLPPSKPSAYQTVGDFWNIFQPP